MALRGSGISSAHFQPHYPPFNCADFITVHNSNGHPFPDFSTNLCAIASSYCSSNLLSVSLWMDLSRKWQLDLRALANLWCLTASECIANHEPHPDRNTCQYTHECTDECAEHILPDWQLGREWRWPMGSQYDLPPIHAHHLANCSNKHHE